MQGKVGKKFPSDKFTSAVMSKWKWIGRQLRVKYESLEAIKQQNKEQRDRCREMLKAWKNSNVDGATYVKLAKALLHRTVGLKEVVEQHLCQERVG